MQRTLLNVKTINRCLQNSRINLPHYHFFLEFLACVSRYVTYIYDVTDKVDVFEGAYGSCLSKIYT